MWFNYVLLLCLIKLISSSILLDTSHAIISNSQFNVTLKAYSVLEIICGYILSYFTYVCLKMCFIVSMKKQMTINKMPVC